MSSERTRWWAIGLLVLAGICAAMQFAKVAAVFEPVRRAYDADDALGGLFISAPAVVGLVLGLTASVLVARAGFRQVLVAALSIGALLSLAQSFVPPLPIFLLTRVLEGVAHLGVIISCPVLIILLSARRHVAITMSVWGAFFGLAFALSGALAPHLEQAGGIGAVFLAHGLLMAVIALAVVFGLPEVAGAEPQRGEAAVPFLRAHLDAYRSPRAFLPGLAFVFHTTMYTPIVTFVPVFADPAAAAALLVWMPLVSIVGTLASGFAGQYLTTPPLVIAAGFAGVAMFITVIWWSLSGEVPIVFAALAMMAFSGLVQGAVFSLIPALSTDPGMASRANGVLTQLGNLGSTVGPPLFALVLGGTGAAGFLPILALTVALCVAGLAVSLFALRYTGVRPTRH